MHYCILLYILTIVITATAKKQVRGGESCFYVYDYSTVSNAKWNAYGYTNNLFCFLKVLINYFQDQFVLHFNAQL